MSGIKPMNVTWDQTGFDRLISTRSPERQWQEAEAFDRIFNAAASPTARAAFEWAQTNGVRFFVDSSVQRAAGYYTPGTGVIGLAEKYALMPDLAIPFLVHEIRHAWQDAHSLIAPATADFATYAIQNALIEADAYAFENLSVHEQRAYNNLAKFEQAEARGFPHHNKAARQKFADSVAAACAIVADQKQFLQKSFMAWFDGARPSAYGHALNGYYGEGFGLHSIAANNNNYEFNSHYTGYARTLGGELGVPIGAGVDITDTQRVLALGKTFHGGNYMTRLPKHELQTFILRPSLAMTFYTHAKPDQYATSIEIRKHSIKQKPPLGPRPNWG